MVSLVRPLLTGTGVPLWSLLSNSSLATAGALVSTMTITAVLPGPVLPAVSVTVDVRLCCPSLSGSVGVKLQLPSLPAVAVPSTVSPSLTVTVLPGSAVPLRVGVVSLVLPPAATGVPSPLLSCRLPAAAGACVSTVTVTGVDAGPVLPAASVTVLVRLWLPSLRGGVVKLQLPSLPTVVLPITVPPSEIITTPPASPLPLRVGAETLVLPVPSGSPSSLVSWMPVGAAGATVSMVMVITGESVTVPLPLSALARNA